MKLRLPGLGSTKRNLVGLRLASRHANLIRLVGKTIFEPRLVRGIESGFECFRPFFVSQLDRDIGHTRTLSGVDR